MRSECLRLDDAVKPIRIRLIKDHGFSEQHPHLRTSQPIHSFFDPCISFNASPPLVTHLLMSTSLFPEANSRESGVITVSRISQRAKSWRSRSKSQPALKISSVRTPRKYDFAYVTANRCAPSRSMKAIFWLVCFFLDCLRTYCKAISS